MEPPSTRVSSVATVSDGVRGPRWLIGLLLAMVAVLWVSPAAPAVGQPVTGRSAVGQPTAVGQLVDAPTVEPLDTAEQADPSATVPSGHSWLVQPAGPLGGADARSYFSYELEPGERIEDVIAVVNHSTTPLTLGVAGADAFTTPEDGSFGLAATAAEPRDVGAWVRTSVDEITVPARSRAEIPFALTVPDNATPGDHAGGVVTSFVSTIVGDDGSEVLFDARIAVRIYLHVPGDRHPVLTTDDVEVTFDTSPHRLRGTLTVEHTLANDGNVRLGVRESVRVTGPFGIALREASSQIDEVLPGGAVLRREVFTDVPKAGRLYVEVETSAQDLGDPHGAQPQALVTSVRVWAVPWLWLLVVLLVVVVIVAIVRVRRRRWRELREEVRQARAGATGIGSPDAETDADAPVAT